MKRCVAVFLLAMLLASAGLSEGTPDAFLRELRQLEAEYGLLIRYWPVEDRYALYAKYGDPIYAPHEADTPRHDIPREGEVTQAEAREAIAALLIETYGEDALDPTLEWVEIVYFLEAKDGQRYWQFMFAHPREGEPDSPAYVYEAHLDAVTGEIFFLSDNTTPWG